MKLVILGGGGFRVPLVYRALLRQSVIDRVVLYDVDPTRLSVISSVLTGLAGSRRVPAVTVSADLDHALRGADFVFAAVRVGGLRGREYDETIPLQHGVLGQETVGLGGIFYALRSIPVMQTFARTVAEVAPDAWLINFTNPAGMVTESLQPILGERVIGICDSPAAMIRRVARALGVRSPVVDYVGLNHLGWLRAMYDEGVEVLPKLLADRTLLSSFEEGQLFGPDLLRALGSIPNEYLHYFYYASDVVASLRGTTTRAAYLRLQQTEFYDAAIASAEPLAVWDEAVDARNRTYMASSRKAAGIGERADEDVEGGGYEQIALEVMTAIATNSTRSMILNVRNGGTVAALDADAVIEVSAIVDGSGAAPQPVAPLTDHQAGLMLQIKAVERATIDAAVSGRRESLYAALAMHPLNGSFPAARAIFDQWAQHFPDVQSRFT